MSRVDNALYETNNLEELFSLIDEMIPSELQLYASQYDGTTDLKTSRLEACVPREPSCPPEWGLRLQQHKANGACQFARSFQHTRKASLHNHSFQ